MTVNANTHPTSELFDPNPGYRGAAHYILPFGREYAKWNPLDPDSHPFGRSWLANGTAFLVQRLDEARTYPTRCIHNAGGVEDDWRIGNTWNLYHDQSDAHLGHYRVVGIVEYGPTGDVARTAGVTPTRRISMSTFK
jgi:hypothetical protein